LNLTRGLRSDSPAGVEWVPGARPKSILARLPAFYRENPGLLGPLTEVVDELLVEFSEHLVRSGDRILGEGSDGAWGLRAGRPCVVSAEVPRDCCGGAGGTREDIVAWLERRVGTAPRLYSGFVAVPQRGGWLEFRDAFAPSVVLAWEKGQLPGTPADFEIPLDLLPATVSVQAILLKRFPPRRRPVAGERTQGILFWRLSRSAIHEAICLKDVQ